MALLLRTHLRLAKTSIRENRTRSFLTCLGIAIGIASIILILSLTGSVSRLISNEVADIGADLIVVRPRTTKNAITTVVEELTSSNSFEKSNLSIKNAQTIARIPSVEAAAPIAVSSNTISTENNTIDSATILATTPSFIGIEPLTLKAGTFLTEHNKSNAVVIGHMLSLRLFNTSNPVGKTLDFRGRRFIVVGILEKIEKSVNFDNVDFDNALFMNINTFDELTGSPQIQQINVRVSTTDDLQPVSDEIAKALREQNSGDNNFSVAYGDEITHPANSLLNIISSILTMVAGISLVVGGIGVMNIMLVSVAERTHEIGIRKAVGASFYNILMQFILESLILSLLGGVLGIILGYILAFLISTITPFAPFISWQIIIITFATTVIVGILFGVYPALKAASKNPIESLKHYR